MRKHLARESHYGCGMTATLLETRLPAPSIDLRAAARDAGSIWVGLFTLGIGFGVLVASDGLPWWLAPIISATMFAGSVEFLLVGMLVASAPIAAIAVTTFLVNSRHLFYGLTFPLHRVRGGARRAYSVFALCDEAYAMLATKDPASLSSSRILWTQFGLHGSWATGALTGGVLGSLALSGTDALDGLDFILTGLFIVLTMDAFREHRDPVALGSAAAAAALAWLTAPGEMLLVAMAAYAASLLLRHRLSRRKRNRPRHQFADA